MKYKAFIHTNTKQYLGALLSKYSLEKNVTLPGFSVEILNVDEIGAFRDFAGSTYLRMGEPRVYDPEDLQSFTLSRFMPPEVMQFEGRAIVIDPDIFALQNIDEIFTGNMYGKAIAACKKKDAWDTSVMAMDCSKLKHWRIDTILARLRNKTLDYHNLMTLKNEDQDSILAIPRLWNNLDTLTDDTRMIHTTRRLTQPWKTGLPIDFTREKMPRLFGIIPREPIHKLLGKYPTHYQKHPDPKIEQWFFTLVRDALKDGAVKRYQIEQSIAAGDVRPDLFEHIDAL